MKDFSRALFLVADNQNNNKGDVAGKYGHGVTLPYESELFDCVRSWRLRGGKFSDIPIYVFCPTLEGISKETQNRIEQLGCTYIHRFLSETEYFTCGYWNVPISGKYLESMIDEDIIIHMDLDMILIQTPNEHLLTPSHNVSARVAVNEHKPTDRYPDFNGEKYPHESNTGFIVSWRDRGFYSDWWDALVRFESNGMFSKDDPEYSIWEERVVDVMYFIYGYPLEFIDKFQVNGDVSNYTDDEIMNLFFFHGHYNMKERNEVYWKTYIKRYVDVRKNK